MFATTSGTTGEPKFIPVTPDLGAGHVAALMRLWTVPRACAIIPRCWTSTS